MLRVARALWPVLFLVPLSWWADRGCSYAGVDPLYHATIWIHERLGWFVAALVTLALSAVATKIVRARRRLARLLSVAAPLLPRIRHGFAQAAADLGVGLPRIAYLDVDERIAATVFGPVILLSRGVADCLDDADLQALARHELIHASKHDAAAGVVWHLAFVALLLPGFEPLERALHARRERRANLLAAAGREDAYLALLARMAVDAELCSGGGIGLDAPARRVRDRWLVWPAPVLIVLLVVALPLSHAEFMHDRPFLLAHHC